ncbi:MAG: hypothetical protein ACE5FD_03820 [Anaerolineae bacterium]
MPHRISLPIHPDHEVMILDAIVPLPGLDGQVKSYDEAQLRSEEARRLFEAGEEAGPWLDDYWKLCARGYSWRIAVYIIWAALPKDKRCPKTQADLATQVLGLSSDRRIRQWRLNNPAIENEIRMLQVSALTKARADIINALIESAGNPDPRASADRKVALEMLGEYIPRQAIGLGVGTIADMTDASTADLAAQAQIPGVGNDRPAGD